MHFFLNITVEVRWKRGPQHHELTLFNKECHFNSSNLAVSLRLETKGIKVRDLKNVTSYNLSTVINSLFSQKVLKLTINYTTASL